ncbi:hypothetical protein BJ322DRAFT_1025247 [Thelephora terrestris]|uniref:Uncharacterized protein n=1 Tax=Thelephora terrestris TaxID=56493 RepID=A0A9P6H505_9AGAM|nr:hypothetical protein BJ322DRAFT_1025247 [Thelephora terrestris]
MPVSLSSSLVLSRAVGGSFSSAMFFSSIFRYLYSPRMITGLDLMSDALALLDPAGGLSMLGVLEPEVVGPSGSLSSSGYVMPSWVIASNLSRRGGSKRPAGRKRPHINTGGGGGLTRARGRNQVYFAIGENLGWQLKGKGKIGVSLGIGLRLAHPKSRDDPPPIGSQDFNMSHRGWAQRATYPQLLARLSKISLMYHTERPQNSISNPPVPPLESSIQSGAYRQQENGSMSRKCPTCGKWIGLGPKGAEWSFQLHTGSNSCAKERKKMELEAARAHPPSKSMGYTAIPMLPPSPFISPVSSAPALIDKPSATRLLANVLPSTIDSHLFPLDPPSPSFGTLAWSAPGSPQVCSTPSISSHIALPSLMLESNWHPNWPALSPLTQIPPAQKSCPGSLVLWEPGDPATTYPFNLHSSEGSSTLPWTVAVGERPGSLRLWSNSCGGVCDPSQPCCQDCAEITSSIKYQQADNRAKNDYKHRVYDKLNWEQLVKRTREKSDLLMKE